jgi:hypothetical protein
VVNGLKIVSKTRLSRTGVEVLVWSNLKRGGGVILPALVSCPGNSCCERRHLNYPDGGRFQKPVAVATLAIWFRCKRAPPQGGAADQTGRLAKQPAPPPESRQSVGEKATKPVAKRSRALWPADVPRALNQNHAFSLGFKQKFSL